MNSTHDDAVFNFDLDFLHPTSNNVPVSALKQKYITQLKKRIIKVETLQNHRLAAIQELSVRTKELEDTKRKLETTTREYTQTSLDYKQALESSARWEKEAERLNNIITKLNSERTTAVDQLKAIQSHAAQLEELVRQQERKIETIEKYDKKNVDKLIAGKLAAKTKENEKEILLWKRKYETLRKQGQDKKCGDRNLNKELLRKCDKLGNEIISVAEILHGHSDNEDNTYVGLTSPFGRPLSSRSNVDTPQKCPITSKENTRTELDSDCSHEVVSVDTGCGSSLSSSDNEKWLNSPDYVFSPIHVDGIENNCRKCVNIATSPIPSVKMVDVATNSVLLVKTADVATSPKLPMKMIDVATSPITIQTESCDSHPKCSVEPLIKRDHDNIQECTEAIGFTETKGFVKIPYVVDKKIQEKECLGNNMKKLSSFDDELCSSTLKTYVNVPCIETGQIQAKDCLDNEMNESSIINNDVFSNTLKTYKKIRRREVGKIQVNECLNNKIETSHIFDNDKCSREPKAIKKIRDVEVEKIQEKEYSVSEIYDHVILEDEICPIKIKPFEELPRVEFEKFQDEQCLNNDIYEPRIFDDEISSRVHKIFEDIPMVIKDNIQKKIFPDNQKDDNHVINMQIESIDIKGFKDISCSEVQDTECSDSEMYEDPIIDNDYTIVSSVVQDLEEIPHIAIENTNEKESPDHKMDDNHVSNKQIESTEIKGFKDVSYTEAQNKVQDLECSDSEMDEDPIDDNDNIIVSTIVIDLEEIPYITIENTEEKESTDHKMDDNDVIIEQIEPTELNSFKDVSSTVVQDKVQETESSNSEMDEDPIIDNDNSIVSTVVKDIKEIPNIAKENIQEKESLDNKMDNNHVITKQIEPIDINSFKDVSSTEVQDKVQDKESSDSEMDEDSIVYNDNTIVSTVVKDFEEISHIAIDNTQEKESPDHKMDDNNVINKQIKSIETNGIKDVCCTEVQDMVQEKECSANEMVENPTVENGNIITSTVVKHFKEIPHIVIDNIQEQESSDNKIDENCISNNKTDIIGFKYFDKIPRIDIQKIQEKKCLELNNSNKMNEDRSTDNEIEMILNAMRVHHKLITPIPRSPKSTCCSSANLHGQGTQTTEDVAHSICVDAAIAREHATTAKQEAASARQDAAKTREENRKLMTALGNLMKDMFNIKCFLKNRLSMPDTLLEHNNDSISQEWLNMDNIKFNKEKFTNNCGAALLDESIINSNLEVSQTVAVPPRDIKITVLSDEIIKPADAANANEDNLLHKTVLGMELEYSAKQHVNQETKRDNTLNETVNVEVKSKDTKSLKNKRRKLTNLDKYRKKCELRKYKIRRETPPLVKPRMKPKQVRVTKKVTDRDTAATLNDTDVYAKAVKIMAELNSKIHTKFSTEPIAIIRSQHNTTVRETEEYNTDIKCKQNTICSAPVASPESANIDLSQSTSFTPVATNSRRSITSPELVVASPKSAVTSRRRSSKSPVITVASPIAVIPSASSSITSPKLALPSPKPTILPVIISSRRSIKSPDLVPVSSKPTVTSPRRSIKSPEMTVKSPTPMVMSPRHCIRSPKSTSPKHTFTTPSHFSQYTEATATSPTPVNTLTRRPVRSPELLSLKRTITSPSHCSQYTEAITSQTPVIAFPRRSIRSPELSSLKRTINTSSLFKSYVDTEVTATSTTPVKSPRRFITSPEVPPLNRTITSPNRFNQDAEATVTSTSPVVTSPRRSIRSPELSSSKSTITSPSSFSRHTEINATSTTPMFTSPRRSIRSPELAPLKLGITSPNHFSQYIDITSPSFAMTSQRRCITSPEIASSSSKPAIMSSKRNHTALRPYVTPPEASITYPELGITSSGPSTNLLEIAVKSSKRSNRFSKFEIPVDPYALSPPLPSQSTSSITTRSRKNVKPEDCFVVLHKDQQLLDDMSLSSEENQANDEPPVEQMSRKRTRSNCSDSHCKRVLRSRRSMNAAECGSHSRETNETESLPMELFLEEDPPLSHPKESILCAMIEKHAVRTVKQYHRIIPDSVLKNITKRIDTVIIEVKETSSHINKQKLMNDLIEEMLRHDYKDFVWGLVQFLIDPQRKLELLSKSSSPPAPQMTKTEEILLYVIRQLNARWSLVDVVQTLLSAIEHNLFKLNRTPDFGVIESTSHFYALLCRYFNLKSQLIAFMLDAMYCILFKSVPLIRQCLDVWPHVIPLAHMHVAKTPLVTCFVYLIHFYKCDDRYNRVQDIRNLLNRKYFYQITEWNENKILDLFNHAIRELKDIPNEKKMLRIALIILGKRHGPRWTQSNIIKKILQPYIEKEDVRDIVKEFCISMIGPLMKPYPVDMKVHCEIAMNQLTNILKKTNSKQIEEAVIASFVIMNRHNHNRVVELLLSRKMRDMSLELEKLIRYYVRTRPLKVWIANLSKMSAISQS